MPLKNVKEKDKIAEECINKNGECISTLKKRQGEGQDCGGQNKCSSGLKCCHSSGKCINKNGECISTLKKRQGEGQDCGGQNKCSSGLKCCHSSEKCINKNDECISKTN